MGARVMGMDISRITTSNRPHRALNCPCTQPLEARAAWVSDIHPWNCLEHLIKVRRRAAIIYLPAFLSCLFLAGPQPNTSP